MKRVAFFIFFTHPIDRIPNGDTRPRQHTTPGLLRPGLGVLPLRLAPRVEGRELGQPVGHGAPAEIVNNQALYHRGVAAESGVNNGVRAALGDSRPAEHADGRVVPGQGLGQLVGGVVVDLDDGDALGLEVVVVVGRFAAGDGGNLEAGADENVGNGAAKVAGGLY